MITVRGIGVLIAAILTFLLAGVTRVGWLYLFDAVLWGALVISVVMPWLVSGKLRVSRRLIGWQGDDPDIGPMVGDTVEFRIRIENRGLLPCMFVSVDYGCIGEPTDPEKSRLFMAWLGRHQYMSSIASVSFSKRGRYELAPIKAVTSVPFGLFRKTAKIHDGAKLVVLPKPEPFTELEVLNDVLLADRRAVAARTGEQVTGSRTYFHGDPVQHMHWRNTARMAQPQVKEFEEDPGNSLVVAFDSSSARFEAEEALEYAIKIVASVGNEVCRSQGTVRLVANNLDDETSDRRHLLETLATYEKGDDQTLAGPLSSVYYSSDVLAVVRDTDAPGIRALASIAVGASRVTAIVLRGFDPDNSVGNAVKSLEESGARVIECWPGRLPEVFVALEHEDRVGAMRQPTNASVE